MFKESEDKYTRIHGMKIRRWLKCEILHQKGQDKVRRDCRTKEALRNDQY
jgi:putative component of membrane protein insertase Oxa1/YidC/SpoIIIJ protein YidD